MITTCQITPKGTICNCGFIWHSWHLVTVIALYDVSRRFTSAQLTTFHQAAR